MRGIFFIFILIFLSSNAYPNDTAFGGSGSSPMPIERNEIKMVDESIRIEGRDIDKENMQGAWQVSCDFTFKNASEQPITLQVGFPFPVYDQESNVTTPAGVTIHQGDALVYNFNVSIDGKNTVAHKQVINANPDKGLYYQNAYLWPMKFAPQQMIKVHHDYTTGITFNVMGESIVSYVLKTGSLWKDGTIGHTQLEVIPNVATRLCSEINPKSYLKPQPAGIKIVGEGDTRKYVWELSNFAPQQDLDLCLITPKNYVRYHIVYPLLYLLGEEPINLKNKSYHELRILKNSIYAQYGKEFVGKDLRDYFNQQWWYKPNPNYSNALLTKEDLQAIKLINKKLPSND